MWIRQCTPVFRGTAAFRGATKRSCVRTIVNWRSWNAAAFEEARSLNRPLFVSSTSDSQWCKLMGSEAFADERNAQRLNAQFVPVQIHKDAERGIDKALMMFLQLKANGQGGWPLNAVLTPTHFMPFIAASYLSADDLGRFLDAGSAAWATKRELCEQVSRDATAELVGIRDGSHGHAGQIDAADAAEQAVLQYESLATQSPRFVMGFALSVLARSGRGRDLCRSVLHAMATAGIVDHLRGGVFAYSISSDWHFPSFQKTLSGQATLLMACAAQLDREQDALVRRLAAGIVQYVGELAPHTSEDYAAAGPWTYAEFSAALKTLGLVDRDIAQMHWGVNESGNINPDLDPLGNAQGQNVLSAHKGDAEVAAAFGVSTDKVRSVVEASRPLLRAYQEEHKAPVRDERVVLSDLGLTLSGLAQVAAHVPEARPLAAGLAEQLRQVPPTDAARTCDDYAYAVMGLLDFHEHVDGDRGWADAAYAWQQAQTAAFADDKGGFFYSAAIENLYFRPKYSWDGAEPNYNGVSARNLDRLAELGYAVSSEATRNVGIHGVLSSPLAHLSFITLPK